MCPRSKRAMKVFLIISVTMLGPMVTGKGQEATDVDLQNARTEQKDRPGATPSPATTPAKPDATPGESVPELSQIDEVFKQTSLGKEADERRLHIEWRKLANQVANDPSVISARRAADAARTDLEKRQRLRVYYTLYYDQMGKLASTPEVKAAIDSLKAGHISSLNQPRVRPSPSASPKPSP
jgi:hypothetical protein